MIRELKYLTRDGNEIHYEEWKSGSKFGLCWIADDGFHRMSFGCSIVACPSPDWSSLIFVFPEWPVAPFQTPDNAAIYNADGTLRCQLKAPKVLTQAFPGCTLSAREIATMPPDGFWNIGRGCSDGIKDFSVPWMWAEIGYGYDFFERRYFDPRTGQFDTEHFSAGRR